MSAAATASGATAGIAPEATPGTRARSETFTLEVADLQAHVRLGSDETLLDGALRAGVALPYDCRAGGCGACRVKVLSGATRYEEEPFALTPEEEAEGFVLSCRAFAASDLVVETAAPAEGLPEPAVHAARVAEIGMQAEGVTRLVLDVPHAADVPWAPGQYLNILAEDGPRAFSMASKPEGGRFELHIRTIAGGAFTAGRLPRLAPGDRLDVELPLGRFVRHADDDRPLLLVATGTGIAPFRAMLQSLLEAGPSSAPVHLYWGMRTPADLYLDAELRALEAVLPGFAYAPVLSRADAAWRGRRGHVQAAVLEDFADLRDRAIYLCGAPDMIRAASAAFLARGADGAHLHTEGFTLRAPAPMAAGSAECLSLGDARHGA